MSVSDRLWRARKFAILGAWNLKYLYFKNIRFVQCRSIAFFHLFAYNSYLIVIPKYSCYILLFIYKIYYYTTYIFVSAVREDFEKCHLVILKRCRLCYNPEKEIFKSATFKKSRKLGEIFYITFLFTQPAQFGQY